MAIEGLGNTYGVPAIKKDQESGMDQKKKKGKKKKKDNKKEEHLPKTGAGKIDIRI